MAKKTECSTDQCPRRKRFTGFTKWRVKELIDLMTANGLTEIELVEDKSRIVLRRGVVTGGAAMAAPMMAQHVHAPAASAACGPRAARRSRPTKA